MSEKKTTEASGFKTIAHSIDGIGFFACGTYANAHNLEVVSFFAWFFFVLVLLLSANKESV
ncbi:MAG: hypothetical protein WC373_17355 [Smithella sp.]|jgi:hypothetical protein